MAALFITQSPIQATWMNSTNISCCNSNKKKIKRFGRNTDKFVTRQFLSHASSLGYMPHKQPRVMP